MSFLLGLFIGWLGNKITVATEWVVSLAWHYWRSPPMLRCTVVSLAYAVVTLYMLKQIENGGLKDPKAISLFFRMEKRGYERLLRWRQRVEAKTS